jgi:hypothetical protein
MSRAVLTKLLVVKLHLAAAAHRCLGAVDLLSFRRPASRSSCSIQILGCCGLQRVASPQQLIKTKTLCLLVILPGCRAYVCVVRMELDEAWPKICSIVDGLP